MKTKNIAYLLGAGFLILNLIGCEAFVRKFTRKPKTPPPHEEMVLEPQVYKSPLSKEGQYRQYFVFWKSWQDELINTLQVNSSHKRQLSCSQEALKNLINLRALLKEDMRKKLDVYIEKLQDLKAMLARDIYCNSCSRYVNIADRLKMDILRDFSFDKIKSSLL